MEARAALSRFAAGVAIAVGVLSESGEAAPARLPLVVEGATLFKEGNRRNPAVVEFTRTVTLPERGVWYVWVRATNAGDRPAVLSWDLDGVQPLLSSRRQMVIQPGVKAQWHSYTRYARGPGFRMQVRVGKPGTHRLTIRLDEGRVELDRVALTLHYFAMPTADGESLDHSDDPGRGAMVFPDPPMRVEGFRDDLVLPAMKPAARTFYIDDTAGDDAFAGRAEKTAWKSVERASREPLKPGDAVLLRRGGRWEGTLAVNGSGTQAAWITLGAYGTGVRPLVRGRTGPGIEVLGRSFIEIRDLAATSDPDGGPAAGAIVVKSGTGPQPKGIRVLNCVAFDAAGPGIQVGCDWEKGNGYDGVVIENCLAFANSGDGIVIHGTDQNGARNGVVRNCTAWGNDGMAGIWIQSAQNGLIEGCLSHDNAVYNIWCWNAINITIRKCEAFRGRPPGAYDDSGGFDIDWGSEACTIEYCYAHHNKGAGILLMGSGTEDYRKFPMQTRFTLCRYNIVEHNGHGILVYNTFEDGIVHNNLAISHVKEKPALELWSEDWDPKVPPQSAARCRFVNNVLVGVEGGYPFAADDGSIRAAGNDLDYNLYWRAGKEPEILRWGGTRQDWENPKYYAAFAGWRVKAGREPHGVCADPLPGSGTGAGCCRPAPAVVAGKGVVVTLDEAWLAGRRKYVTETGATAYGIPMEPAQATTDFQGRPLDPALPAIGPER